MNRNLTMNRIPAMKRVFAITGLALLMIINGHAQIADPVKWTFSHEKSGEMEAELVFKATIDMPWHLYSAYLPDGGPIATKPYYNESDVYSLVDGIVEVTKPKVKFDEGFKMELGTISGRAELRQKVKFNNPGTYTITGEIEFQVCDDATCLPPKYVEFSFTVTAGETTETESAPSLSGLIQQESGDEEAVVEEGTSASTASIAGVPAMEEEKSLWRFFWLAFGLGLLALLTPCVFPMIPMTVSFFMQGGDNKARGFFRDWSSDSPSWPYTPHWV